MCWASSLWSWICRFTGCWIPAWANSSRVTGDDRSSVDDTVDTSGVDGNCSDVPLPVLTISCARIRSATLMVDVVFCGVDSCGCWSINCSCGPVESDVAFCTPDFVITEVWFRTFWLYIVVVPHAVLAFANPARSNASMLRPSSTSVSCFTDEGFSSCPSNSSLLRESPWSWFVNDANSDTANFSTENMVKDTECVNELMPVCIVSKYFLWPFWNIRQVDITQMKNI